MIPLSWLDVNMYGQASNIHASASFYTDYLDTNTNGNDANYVHSILHNGCHNVHSNQHIWFNFVPLSKRNAKWISYYNFRIIY